MDLTQNQGSSNVVAPDAGQTQQPLPIQADGQNVQPDAQGVPQPTVEPKPPAFDIEPTDQSERSALGRRVKRMEDNVTQFMTRMDEFMTSLQPQQQQNTPENEIISTAADVNRVLEQRERVQMQARQKYQNEFLDEVSKLGNENPDLHAEITREMFEVQNSPFNQYRTGNATADANWNYSRALKAVLAKRYANPQRHTQSVPPPSVNMSTGVPVGTRTQTPALPPVALDEHARLFQRKMGLSDEQVQKYLAENKG